MRDALGVLSGVRRRGPTALGYPQAQHANDERVRPDGGVGERQAVHRRAEPYLLARRRRHDSRGILHELRWPRARLPGIVKRIGRPAVRPAEWGPQREPFHDRSARRAHRTDRDTVFTVDRHLGLRDLKQGASAIDERPLRRFLGISLTEQARPCRWPRAAMATSTTTRAPCRRH